MAKPNTPILLLIEREGHPQRVEEFEDNIIKIGKLASVNLRLDDPGINRIHAVIEVTDATEAQVIDMGSSKGTHVNGKRIHKTKVVSGDELLLGETKIRIFLGEEAVGRARNGDYGSAAAPEAAPAAAATFTPAAMGGDVGGSFGADSLMSGLDIGMTGDDDLLAGIGGGASGGFESTQVTRNPLLAEASAPVVESEDTSQHSAEAAQSVREAVAAAEATAQTAAVPETVSQDYNPPAQVDYQEEPQPQYAQQQEYPPQQPQYAQQQEYPPQPPQYAQQQEYPPQPPQYAQQQEYPPQPQYAQPPQGYGMPPQPQGYGMPPQGYGMPPQAPQGYGMSGAFPQGAYPQPTMSGDFQQAGFPQQQPMQPAMPSIAAPAPVQPVVMDAQFADTQEVLEIRVMWGESVLDHAHFYNPKRITIGESRKNTFSLSSEALPEGMASFTLVESKGDRLMVNFTDQMRGTVTIKDQLFTLDQIKQSAKVERGEFGHQFALPAQSQVHLTIGQMDFLISFVPAPKRIVPGFLNQMDLALARAMGTSFLIHGLAFLFMLLSDEAPQAIDDSFFNQKNRFAQLIVRPPEKEEEKKKKDPGGARAKEKEGKMGRKTPDAPKVTDRRAGQKQRNPDATAPIDMKKVEKELLDKVGKQGMLGLLGGGQSAYGAILTAKGFGGDDADAVGAFQGAKVGDASGGGGLGVRAGGGSGGGGLSGLGVGIGSLGTYGRGGGKGGRGWGQGKLAGKRKQSVDVETGPPMVFGSLDKEIIRRVINSHRSRIKYCYERELSKYPKLQGKIKVFFQIEGNGMVSTSKVRETTMNNERVEECLAQRVKIMRFPAPKGGGIVQVNYPFFFKPS